MIIIKYNSVNKETSYDQHVKHYMLGRNYNIKICTSMNKAFIVKEKQNTVVGSEEMRRKWWGQSGCQSKMVRSEEVIEHNGRVRG